MNSLRIIIILFLTLFAQAVSAQSPEFLQGLIKLQQGDPDGAFIAWKPLAGAGDADAQYGMALLYENGGNTFQADLAKAVTLYKQAAGQGLKEAQTNLGLLHAEGRGVNQDAGKAASYWQSAAQSNHDMAQFNLGLAYYGGNGVPQNLQEAVGLIYAAAAQGLPEAQFAFGQFHRLGLGVEKSDEQALYWFSKSAAAGNPDAVPLVAEIKAEGKNPAIAPDPALQPLLPLALEGSEAANSFGQSVSIPQVLQQPALVDVTGESPLLEQQLNSVLAPVPQQPVPQAVPQQAPASVFAQPPIQKPVQQPIQQPVQQAPVPQSLGNFPPAQEPVMIEAGQSQGLLYAAWLGTEKTVPAVRKLWQKIVPLQPDVFTQVQAGIEMGRVNKKTVYRLMVGPFPSKSIAWQICNAVKISNPTLFCKARLIE